MAVQEFAEEHLARLAQKQSLLRAEWQIKKAARALADKLTEEIERGHMTTAFIIAVTFAAFKDALDLEWIAIPIIGNVIGFFLGLIITYFSWRKGWFLNKWRLWLIWIICTLLIDNLPEVSALPMETIAMLNIWRVVRNRAKKAEIKFDHLDQLSGQEIEALTNDISLLDQEEAA